MMNVRDCDGIPGAAGQRTRPESLEVTDEVGDDHFHDFVREAVGGLLRGTRLQRRVAEEAIDLGSALMPNGHHANGKVSP